MADGEDVPSSGAGKEIHTSVFNSVDILGSDQIRLAQTTDQNQMEEYRLPNGARLYMSPACNSEAAYIVDRNGTRHNFDQRTISAPIIERNPDGTMTPRPRPSEIWRSQTFNEFNIGIERMPDGRSRVFHGSGNNFREIFGRPCLIG